MAAVTAPDVSPRPGSASTAHVHSADRLNHRDHPRSSDAIAAALERDGVQLGLGRRAERLEAGAGRDGAHRVTLADGSSVDGQEVMLAIGRTAPLYDPGLENVGVELVDGRVTPDEHLRIADGTFVIGDPAGPEMHTHLAHYQGEMVVRIALGDHVRPDRRAIPRAIGAIAVGSGAMEPGYPLLPATVAGVECTWCSCLESGLDQRRARDRPVTVPPATASNASENPTMGVGQGEWSGTMGSHDSKAVVRRYLDEMVSGGKVDLGQELIADDVSFSSPYTPEPVRGREGLQQLLVGIHAAFPDFFLREEELVGEGELVAARWVAGGTHAGAPFNGAPASGRRFEITGMSIYRVRDGRIVEGWVNDDTYLMRAQLGLIAEQAQVG